MSEHKITIMVKYVLLYFRIPHWAQKRICMSNCQVSVMATVYMVIKSYVEANNANVEIINSYVW